MAELCKLESDVTPKDPFRSAPHAKDVASSTLGQTARWALHNPLVWIIDSRIDSTKMGGFWMLRYEDFQYTFRNVGSEFKSCVSLEIPWQETADMTKKSNPNTIQPQLRRHFLWGSNLPSSNLMQHASQAMNGFSGMSFGTPHHVDLPCLPSFRHLPLTRLNQ